MPKEVIHSIHTFREGETSELLTEVRWSREGGDVQLATVQVERANHSPITESVCGGWYVDLDRRAINDLIRHLRRARDAAFGRDE